MLNEAARDNMIALASKKKGNARSRMLKMIMPYLSQQNGQDLSKAIDDMDSVAFKSVWDHIKHEIAEKMKRKHTSLSCDGGGAEKAVEGTPVQGTLVDGAIVPSAPLPVVENAPVQGEIVEATMPSEAEVDSTFKSLYESTFNKNWLLERVARAPEMYVLSSDGMEDMESTSGVNKAEADILNGSGVEREQLREFLAFGTIMLKGGIVYRLERVDTLSSLKYGSVLPLSYKITTHLYDLENERVLKTFTGTGHFVKTIHDNLLVAKAYLENKSSSDS